MPGVIVVGLQWGDEGKGKIVDFLASRSDMVVRFNGGSNAGHSVVVEGVKYKFHIMPSGVLSGKQVALAGGVVIDPQVFVEKELAPLNEKKIMPKLSIDSKCHIVTPYHKALDAMHEDMHGKAAAGSTRSGIAPVFSDKHGRVGIRVQDLMDEAVFRAKVSKARERFEAIARCVYKQEPAVEDFTSRYLEYAAKMRPFVSDSTHKINEALDEGQTVLFEAAQGAMLDVDHGIYPMTTSSNTISGAACTGAGVGPTKIKRVFGVIKAYTSRVGNGPLPTELLDETGSQIREKGHEYGTTTGRPRRIGWLDTVSVKYAAMLNGVTDLAVVHLDTLSGFKEVRMCVAYKYGGEELLKYPTNTEVFAKVTPVYKTFKGWEDVGAEKWREIAKSGKLDMLPPNCLKYLKAVKKYVGAPLSIVSVGADRTDTIVLKDL